MLGHLLFAFAWLRIVFITILLVFADVGCVWVYLRGGLFWWSVCGFAG